MVGAVHMRQVEREARTFIVSSPCEPEAAIFPARSPEEAVAIFLEMCCAVDEPEIDVFVRDEISAEPLKFHVDFLAGSFSASA